MRYILLTIIILACTIAISCKHSKQAQAMPPVQKPMQEAPKEIAKTEASTEFSVVQSIFQKNNNVEISRCWKNGKKYFRAQMNVYDGGDKIYDETGKQVASCTPMSHADALCSMDKYEVIYTPSKNIWGHKGIDVLEIAN